MFDSEKFRELRRRRGISQREMARALGVTQGYISKLETGFVQSPGLLHLRQITGTLQLPLDSLLRENAGCHSAFICYGDGDRVFAAAVHDALCAHGVDSFFLPRSARPGQRFQPAMAQAVNSRDRVVLLCSRNSLTRHGVRYELMLTLAREAREGGKEDRIIPVLLDDYLPSGEWTPEWAEIVDQVAGRVPVDFRGVAPDTPLFHARIEDLLRGLRRE